MALLSRRVEVHEQRLNLAQKASYVALFRNVCASGEGKARKPGGVQRCAGSLHLSPRETRPSGHQRVAGLSVLLQKAKCILFYSRVLRGV